MRLAYIEKNILSVSYMWQLEDLITFFRGHLKNRMRWESKKREGSIFAQVRNSCDEEKSCHESKGTVVQKNVRPRSFGLFTHIFTCRVNSHVA